MKIRRAQIADAETVAKIHVASWDVAYRGIMPDDVIARTDVAYRTHLWNQRLGDGAWPVFLLEDEGQTVAFCHMYPTHDPDDDPKSVGHITSVHVLPHLRGRGYGRRLIDHVVAEFRRRKFREITLWVLEENRKARIFYDTYGFRPDGGKKTYPNTAVPEVRYRLTL
jgi:ribosomal protein S18 acetylase RimI-like enzyme